MLTSVAFCVWALLWNVKNARFEVRSLWNENATQRSNTTQSNCVYFCLCACALWVVQSRSEFRFCSWLKTKIPPVHRMWVTCISVQHQVLFFTFLFWLKCPDFTSPAGFLFFLTDFFLCHQSVSGWPGLFARSCFHAAQWQTPVGFLTRGRNWTPDGSWRSWQQAVWDGRQVMS